MEPKISVIIPCYNIAPWLPRCLDSVLAQTYGNIEVVVVNDGSTDGTGAVIDTYAAREPRIKAIHKENGGVTSARLRGVQEASGQWIGFVDGDDCIEPDMYERLLYNARQYGADISHCGYRMVFPDGRVNYFYDNGLLLQHDKITALRELLSGTMVEPGLCNKLFRRELLQELIHKSSMPTDIKINEDLLMNFYLFLSAECSVYEGRCPYHYIVRSTSASRQKLNESKIFDPIRVKQIILDHAPEALQISAKRAYMDTCLNICNTLLVAGSKTYADELAQVRTLLAQCRADLHLLGHKRSLMAKGVLSAPRLYGVAYRVYEKYFQEKKYS